MTAHCRLSRRRRAARAAWMRRSQRMLGLVCALVCLWAARPTFAQLAREPQPRAARSGRTPWQRYGKPGGQAPQAVARRQQIAPEYQGNYAPEGFVPPQGAPSEVYTEAPYEAGYGDGTTIEGTPPPVEYREGEFAGEGPGYYGDAPCDDGSCGTSLYTEGPYPAFAWDRLYVRADYLLWWGKGFWAPPLVTTSTLGTPREEAGILGLPTTSVLYPHGNLTDTIRSGGRVRLGFWLDECDTSAIEGSYFALANANEHFNASQDDFPILARPFVNIETNAVGNDAELVAYPDLFSGNISVVANSRLQGAEVFLRHALCRGCDWRVDCLIGWRFNRLDETLAISDTKTVLSGETGLTVGTVLSEFDRFSTRNYFNGVQIGVITERVRCRWWFETRATLALGNNRSIVNIDGQATAVVPVPNMPDQVIVTPAGLLAQSTNIGQYENDDFAVVPQLGVNVGYEVLCGLWATVGYNFMYWSRVARPGEQIDTDVNLSQLSPGGLVGLARPEFTDAITDYWAQGLTFGLAYRF